jgi:Transposase domain (DUF772)
VPAATGRPPYDPRDLLKLYVYGYLNEVRSSRRLERECSRNVEVMWLLRRLAPGEAAYEYWDGKIRQIGLGKQRYAPLAAHQSLYLDFAQLGSTATDYVAFAERWGLLTNPASSSKLPSEDLSFWRSEIKKCAATSRCFRLSSGSQIPEGHTQEWARLKCC